jgi:hypothetical protein
MVLRTGSYTYDASVWDLSIVQGPFFCRAVSNHNITIRNFCIAVRLSVEGALTERTAHEASTSASYEALEPRTSQRPHVSTSQSMEPSHGVMQMNSSFQWMPMSATFSVALDRMGSLRHPPPTVMASCSSSANELHCGAGRYLLSPPDAIVERTRGWTDEEVASGGRSLHSAACKWSW